MHHLISVRTNIMYAKNKKEPEKYVRFTELIFLVDKPHYSMTNDGDIIRERAVEELRLIVSDEAFTELIKIMQRLKDSDESELV